MPIVGVSDGCLEEADRLLGPPPLVRPIALEGAQGLVSVLERLRLCTTLGRPLDLEAQMSIVGVSDGCLEQAVCLLGPRPRVRQVALEGAQGRVSVFERLHLRTTLGRPLDLEARMPIGGISDGSLEQAAGLFGPRPLVRPIALEGAQGRVSLIERLHLRSPLGRPLGLEARMSIGGVGDGSLEQAVRLVGTRPLIRPIALDGAQGSVSLLECLHLRITLGFGQDTLDLQFLELCGGTAVCRDVPARPQEHPVVVAGLAHGDGVRLERAAAAIRPNRFVLVRSGLSATDARDKAKDAVAVLGGDERREARADDVVESRDAEQ